MDVYHELETYIKSLNPNSTSIVFFRDVLDDYCLEMAEKKRKLTHMPLLLSCCVNPETLNTFYEIQLYNSDSGKNVTIGILDDIGMKFEEENDLTIDNTLRSLLSKVLCGFEMIFI